MIDVEDFHKAFGRTVAVRDVSFRVEPGEILGLVGPNGAGKTTTLRTLCTLIAPTRGRLSVAGFDVWQDALEVRRRLALVPDDPQLFSDLSVEQHLAFVAAAYRVEKAEAHTMQLLEEFELADRVRTPARELSRGMRQKLAIACAYLRDPQALLFDEPLTGLDPRGIRRLKDSIRQRAAAGAAIIVSSHLLAMVEDICTHVLILNAGFERFFGPVETLRAAFATPEREVTLEEIFFRATEDVPSEAEATHRDRRLVAC